MAHPNEELLRRAYDAFARGDLDTVLSLFSDTIHWLVQGENPLSGVYVGHEQVRRFLEALGERSGGTFRVDIHDVLANDEHGVVLVTVRAERKGKTLAHTEAHVWHLSKGKATEYWHLPTDPAVVDRFWA